MTLADTSVWVDHLRRGNRRLAQLLLDGEVLCHPFVIGELSCGFLTKRGEILSLLETLPALVVTNHDEVLRMVDSNRLYGRGLGWIDMHLLASAVLARSSIWTLDKSLAGAARTMGVAA
jgi:predicted nucleic acid-binding protein